MADAKIPSAGNQDEGPLSADLNLAQEFPAPSYEQWREKVVTDLKGADFDKKLLWKTLEGITVKPIYTKADIETLEQKNNLPGFAPFTRGTQPLSGVAYPWQIRQDCTLAAPEDVNASLRDGLARGQTAIGLRLDNAARQGFDGDSPEARELAGRGGCTLSSINGLRIALADIDLNKHPITIRTGSAALPVLAMLVALAQERGIDSKSLVGSVECDPFRELTRSGTLRGTFDLKYKEMTDLVKYCKDHCPGIRPVMINAHSYHNSGASVTQELAMTLAAATEYMRELINRGVDADTAAMNMMFSFSVSTNMFSEIAKLRAARTLWAKIVKAFGAKNEDSLKMFLHVRTSTYNKTSYDPYNNMLRSSFEAFAGAVGGCDSMYIAPFDESFTRPNEFSMRVARNQHIILQEEVHLNKVVDPSAGSYYVESLTDSIGREAWIAFQEIEADGGLLKALQSGKPQEAIVKVSEKRIKLAQSRQVPIVGVSSYANPAETKLESRRIPREEFLAKRRDRINRLKSIRKNSEVRSLQTVLTQAVYSGEGNLVDIAIKAAAEGATIGEITTALIHGDEGDAPVVTPLPHGRIAKMYEDMRDRSEAYKEKNNGEIPSVYLVPMGPLVMRRARVDFCRGFFAAAGFQSVEPETSLENVDDAVKVALASGSQVFVVCSDDASYPEIVPPFVEKLKAAKSEAQVFVAGYPKDSMEALEKAGVDGFVHIRTNVVEFLSGLQEKLGIGS